jgi:heparosan-N-sulfate-glucuronate 5-epimerase
MILSSYSAMFRHWAAMATGHSYWHVPQGVGKFFVPGALEGYFNDLTAKTEWPGDVDEQGLPVLHTLSGFLHFPTVLFQKGLGHWDRWLQSGRCDREQLRSFLAIVEWTIAAQDERGGWALPYAETRYSAMTQGEGISLLCRAYSLGDHVDCLDRAARAASLMLTSASEGGTARRSGDGLVLEEFPSDPPKTVLNGWIFALYGLYDLCLIRDEAETCSTLRLTVRTLAKRLRSYDAGYWSYYDSAEAIASPFYHRLHIAQLRSLARTFADSQECYGSLADRFEAYLLRKTFHARAVLVKVRQKLLQPPNPL